MTAGVPLIPAGANDPVAHLVRIEMRDATWDDYELLHQKMEEIGFLKQVRSDCGPVFNLPDAEYHGLSYVSTEGLRDAVLAVATNVRANASVLVTRAPAMAWYLPLA